MFSHYINRFYEVNRFFDLTIRVTVVIIALAMIMTFVACETLDRAYSVEKTIQETSYKVQILEQKLDSILNNPKNENDSTQMP